MERRIEAECPRVGVVIPTHNRREVLLDGLRSLRRLEGARVTPYVVCDGCTDGTPESVRAEFPEARVLEGDGSLWWSGCINRGLEAALADGMEYVCLLNDDVSPHPRMLAELIPVSRSRPHSLVGPVVYNQDAPGEIWCAGGAADWRGAGIRMRSRLPEGPDPAPVEWLPGMGTLIPAELARELGGMDAAAFPQYFGDVDFCLRAGRAGVAIYVCPAALLYNHVELTGHLLPPGPIRWKQASALLGSIRSHSNWTIRWRFWRRHCPLPLALWQGLRFYGVLLPIMAKKLSWDHLRAALRPRRPVDSASRPQS